jgi:hypothetical protein
MHVMAAGMRHRGRLAGRVRRRDCAGIGQSGRLLDRQAIHVGAQHDRRTLAVAQQSDDAGLTDPGRHLIAVVGEMFRGEAGCSDFLHRKFGVGVNVLIGRLQCRQQVGQTGKKPDQGVRWVHGSTPAKFQRFALRTLT